MKNNEEIDTQAKKTFCLRSVGMSSVFVCVPIFFLTAVFLKTGERSSIHIKKSL
jgi:surface polysaccharide O-acyltransferase-like enzyme